MNDHTPHDRDTDEVPSRIERRQFLTASGLVGASAVAGIGTATTAGMASAATVDTASVPGGFRRYELSDDGLGNAQTDTPPFCPRLTTHEGRQYYAYWTHAGKMVVAVRDLPDGKWDQNHTDIDIGTRDGHWTPALGIGPDGHVFLSYNTRNSVIRWRRSTDPRDVTSFGPERVGMTGQNESSATYPEFTRLRDGTLLCGYRQGGSGNGDWILNRWDGDEEAWRPLQHPLTDGQAGDQTFNSYHWNLVQSGDGRLHYFFCWRGTGGVETNRNLCYAGSSDGGETWERSDGSAYELPITEESSEVVDDIDPGSDFINNGWASYDPRNDAPHVAYYRDDEDGNTQVFHAYLDDEWVVEPATDRGTSVDFGGGGVIASPIGRMGIVVGDEGDVHVLTRDYERGGWPLLIEKLDGEWRTSVLYKRNLAWSDVHIDPERWRQDRVLSFIDHQQNVRNVPWSVESIVGISDVDPDELERTTRTVDSWDADELTTYVSTDVLNPPVTTESTSFRDTATALALTETTIPATPAYARLQVTVDEDAGSVEARVKVQGEHGTTYGTPARAGEGDETATAEWTRIPAAFRAGFVNVQVRATEADEPARITDGELEVGYVDPTPFENTIVPHGGTR